ncbi:MAG: hypothetical protein E7460_09095 [Ruminococcaceae bacterium]|nr:hypothetical protein [Oscillospiraceae bacterium]
MKIIQRIDSSPRQAELLFEALKNHPGCFTDVWLNTAYGYPKNEDHFKTADYYSGLAEKFRSKGINVSLQLSNTIGHGTYMAIRDCSGLVHPGSPVRKIVGHDGKVCEFGFCWNDPFFRSYITEHVAYYVKKVRPAELWIDDDLRATNHAPVNFGCFCESCMADFNRRNSSDYTREELVAEFLHGDISLREKFIGFIREGLADFVTDICRAVHENCPDTVVCLQNGANGPYTGPDLAHLFDAMLKTTGHAPMYRAGAGTYDDHDPNEIIAKAVNLEFQHSKLPSYVTRKCPEIENLPNTASGKTMTGTALETAVDLAAGATDISYAMLGSIPEDFDFYLKGFEIFAAQRPYWERLAGVSARSVHGGITYAHTKVPHLRPLRPEDDLYSFNFEHYGCFHFMQRWGIPVGYAPREKGVNLLHPWPAGQMSDRELEELLSQSVITDGETVNLLAARGFDLGVRAEPLPELDCLRARELFTSHPANDVGSREYASSFFAPGPANHYALTALPESAEPLGRYAHDPKLVTDAVITTPRGGRWAIIGYSPWKYTVPTFQRERFAKIADYIAPGAVSSRVLSPVQAHALVRVDRETGKTLALSVLNCTVEPWENVKLLIRNPQVESFTLITQYDGQTALLPEKTEDGFVLTLPRLSPWTLGTVFCG